MAGLRRLTLGGLVLILLQAAIGMVVNLYVTIPGRHPGPPLTTSPAPLAASDGRSRLASRAVRAWSILGALLVVGAGFNGASFLDYNHNVSSLIMALLAFGAVACYAVVLSLLPAVRTR
jgi:hypothetical protein